MSVFNRREGSFRMPWPMEFPIFVNFFINLFFRGVGLGVDSGNGIGGKKLPPSILTKSPSSPPGGGDPPNMCEG